MKFVASRFLEKYPKATNSLLSFYPKPMLDKVIVYCVCIGGWAVICYTKNKVVPFYIKHFNCFENFAL